MSKACVGVGPIGMTDAELEHACSGRDVGFVLAPYWTAEVYSLGKCLRYWTGYPRLLPLFVYSDHGVALYSRLFPHELDNSARVHLTWSPMKEERYKSHAKKQVVRIIHPWVAYRRLKGVARTKNPAGTLVFFMHGTDAVEWDVGDHAAYIKELKRLPEKFQPVVLCLHMHDINAGLHKRLRAHGLPMVTVGHANSPNFVDRFYDLVRVYSYTTAQAWGSNAAYCVELGVPYFQMGSAPVLINKNEPNLPTGAVPRYWDGLHEGVERRVDELFGAPVDEVTAEQRAFVEGVLGLDSTHSRWGVLWILWREFFRNWSLWKWVPMFALSVLFRGYSFLSKIKQIKRNLKRGE